MTPVKRWTDALRRNNTRQITGYLAEVNEDGEWGYCAWGVACKEFMGDLNIDMYIPDAGNAVRRVRFGGTSQQPPRVLASLLVGDGAYRAGVDFGDIRSGYGSGYGIRLGIKSIEVLNDDWRFTFEQIADCIDYFGLVDR